MNAIQYRSPIEIKCIGCTFDEDVVDNTHTENQLSAIRIRTSLETIPGDDGIVVPKDARSDLYANALHFARYTDFGGIKFESVSDEGGNSSLMLYVGDDAVGKGVPEKILCRQYNHITSSQREITLMDEDGNTNLLGLTVAGATKLTDGLTVARNVELNKPAHILDIKSNDNTIGWWGQNDKNEGYLITENIDASGVLYAKKIELSGTMSAIQITANSQSGYPDHIHLFGTSGILADIDKRLNNLGFKKGSVFSELQTDPIGEIYKLGACYYGRVTARQVTLNGGQLGYLDGIDIPATYEGLTWSVVLNTFEYQVELQNDGNNYILQVQNVTDSNRYSVVPFSFWFGPTSLD